MYNDEAGTRNNYRYGVFSTVPSQIYNKVNTGEKLKVEHVVSVLEKQYPYVEVNSIFGVDSAYDQNRKVRIHVYRLDAFSLLLDFCLSVNAFIPNPSEYVWMVGQDILFLCCVC